MSHLPRRKGWRKYMPRHPRDVNKREQMLLMLGFIWVLIGLSTFEAMTNPIAQLLHEYIPLPIRGSMWIGTGVIAMMTALRPPGFTDRIGWGVLYLMPTLRVVSYLLAWAASFEALPLDDWALTDAYENGWRFAAVYMAQSLTVVICAGWPNPIDPRKLEEAQHVT